MRGLNVREVREALDGLPDGEPVVLLLDHALAGHIPDDTGALPEDRACDLYDVELAAPVIGCTRTAVGVELRVAWEEAG